MIITLQELYKKLQLTPEKPDDKQLEVLKNWYQEHVSTDMTVHGNLTEQYAKYLHLAKDYIEHFSIHAKADSSKPVPTFNHMSTIQYAAAKGYNQYLAHLLAISPGILNQTNAKTPMTALHLATTNLHIHTIESLLALGASPNAANQTGQLPIHTVLLACALEDDALSPQKKAVFDLLRYNAPESLAHTDDNGNTVFHLLAERGLTDLFISCLQQEPQGIFIKNSQGHTPIHTAALNRHTDMINTLTKIPKVAELTDSNGRACLHYAAQYGFINIISSCSAANSELINMPDDMHQTPLMLGIAGAHRTGHLEILQALFDAGAHTSLTDDQDANILHKAIDTMNPRIISWVLTHIDDDTLHHANMRGESPLAYLQHRYHHSTHFADIETQLLAKGACVRAHSSTP